jgi:hypothetical protein
VRSKEDLSLGTLFAELSQEIGALVRQELALARIEISDNASRLGRDVAVLAVGAAILYAGFLAAIAAVIVGLGLVINSLVLSAFVVAIVVLGVGYGFVRRGLANLKGAEIAPRQTVHTLKINADWARDQFR